MSPLRVPWAIEKLKAASGWEEKGTLARLAYPVELLFIVLRDLTIPMVEEEKYSRPVCALSLGGAAQFVTFVVVGRGKWLGLDDEDRNSTLVGGVMPISVVVLLASLLPVALLYWRLDPKAPPTGGLATALLVGLRVVICGPTSSRTSSSLRSNTWGRRSGCRRRSWG